MSQDRFEIIERAGKVFISIDNQGVVVSTAFPPEQALEVAETLAKHAYHAHNGFDAKDTSVIADRLRARLTPRISLMLKSMDEQKKGYDYKAQSVVDVVLTEAF